MFLNTKPLSLPLQVHVEAMSFNYVSVVAILHYAIGEKKPVRQESDA